MPVRIKRTCKYPGCPQLTEHGSYCEQHKPKARDTYDRNRPSASERGYGAKWQQVSKAYLKAHPFCQCPECKALKRNLPSEVVHHEPDHGGDMRKFWDRSTWRAYAKRCHDRITANEHKFGRI